MLTFLFFLLQAKYLGDNSPPVFVIVARAVRSDRKMGFHLAAYVDKPNTRVQWVLSSITENHKWKICADTLVPSQHKVAVSLTFLQFSVQVYFNCLTMKQYKQ